jgi:hypothetical protein
MTMLLPRECILPIIDMADKWRLTADRLKTVFFSVEMKSLLHHKDSFLFILGCDELHEKSSSGLLSSFNRITWSSQNENILIL